MQVNTLSELSGVKAKTIASYMSARERTPSADAAVSIAKALGVTAEYLVTGKDVAAEKEAEALASDIRLIAQVSRTLGKKDRGVVLNLAKYLRDHSSRQ